VLWRAILWVIGGAVAIGLTVIIAVWVVYLLTLAAPPA
jgi:hypothetical protein